MILHHPQPCAFVLAILIASSLVSTGTAAESAVGKRYPSEKLTYVDRVTGLPVTVLTTDPASDSRIYQTHPQWTHDQQYIIFRSNRSGGRQQAFAVHEITGDIIQLTDDPGTQPGSINISRLDGSMYYLKRAGDQTQLVRMDLDRLFADSAAGTSTSRQQSDYERVIAVLPEGLRNAGGFGIDADGTKAYVGVDRLGLEPQITAPADQEWRITQTPGGLRSVDLRTGEWGHVIDVPFRMGHVQTNPWVPGEIIYCHETGGDAHQRMWAINGDGSNNRPLFPEEAKDWVTHEVVVTPDEVMFNLMGHLDRLRSRPTGIAVLNLRTGAMQLLGQIQESMGPDTPYPGPGGYWHCNGSPDGRWAAGDTFNGDLYLIDRQTGEQILLTTGHHMRPDHIHPSFSADSTRILMQSGHRTGGRSLDIMVMTIPQNLRNRR